jgi:sulfoxide reductase heme-binding subunit YedZ
MRSRRTLWLKIVTHVAALAPLALLAWDTWRDGLGADPIGELTRRSGRAAIVLLLLSLMPTVVRTLTGFRGLLRLRRALGLYAFLYAALHFLVFAGLDYGFDVELIWQAIREGRRVVAGLVAGIILLPLALTSTNRCLARLGANWKRLHRLVYLAAVLAVLHYAWSFKELRAAPVLAGMTLLLLLVLRLPPVGRALARARGTPPASSEAG